MQTETYGTEQVARIADVTTRQMQWWDERKLVTPIQEGHRRLYSAPQALEAAVVAGLRRRKLSLIKIRAVLTHLKKHTPGWAAEALETSEPSEAGYLVTDGKHGYYLTDTQQILKVFHASGGALYCITLGDIIRRIPGWLQ